VSQIQRPEADLILVGDWVLASPQTAVPNGAVAVSGGTIIQVGPQEEILRRYIPKRVLGGPKRMVTPGLINTHTHLFQSFLKGLGEGLPLRPWVERVTTPAAVAIDPEEAYLSAAIGLIEALHSGTTAVFEYGYAFPDPTAHEAVVAAFRDLGLRGWIGIGVNDAGADLGVHPRFIQPIDQAIQKVENVRQFLATCREAPLQVALVSGSVRGLSSEGLRAFHQYAEAEGLLYSLHLKETPDDDEVVLKRHGSRAVPWLEQCGVLTPSLLAVHCVWLDAGEVATLAKAGCGVSHNPVSNMYLGAGIAPVAEMLEQGMAVGLGTDGPASNNSMDILQTLKFAVLAQRARKANPNALTSKDGFYMATEGGARALRAHGFLGRLQPGYAADMTVFRIDSYDTVPCHDPYATLAFSAGPMAVETVVVQGRILLDGGRILAVDEADLIDRAARAAQNLVRRASITAGWKP
jgi:5-methylthioadenosine/S-adenosylhomocysteine deaminase